MAWSYDLGDERSYKAPRPGGMDQCVQETEDSEGVSCKTVKARKRPKGRLGGQAPMRWAP